MTADPFKAMEDLITLGIDRILTSGQQPTAPQGAGLIRELISRSAGRIFIMPGSGVKEHNVAALVRAIGATEVHMRLEKKVFINLHSNQINIFRHILFEEPRGKPRGFFDPIGIYIFAS